MIDEVPLVMFTIRPDDLLVDAGVDELAGRPGGVVPAPWQRHEATTIKFTSGSTAEPKGCPLPRSSNAPSGAAAQGRSANRASNRRKIAA